jgi:hypothetical protein
MVATLKSKILFIIGIIYLMVGSGGTVANILLEYDFDLCDGLVQIGGGVVGCVIFLYMALSLDNETHPPGKCIFLKYLSSVGLALSFIFFLFEFSALVSISLKLKVLDGWVGSIRLAHALDFAAGRFPYADPETGKFSSIHNAGFPYLLGQLFRFLHGDRVVIAYLFSTFLFASLVFLVGWITYKATRDRLSTVFTALIVSTVLPVMGLFPTFLKQDILAIIFMLSACYLFAWYKNIYISFLAGISLGLSFICKMNFPFPALGAVLILIIAGRRRKQGVVLFTAFISFCLLEYFYMQFKTSGWFWFWVFELPRKHPITFSIEKTAATARLFLTVPVLIALSIHVLTTGAFQRKDLRELIWILTAIWGLAVGILGYLKIGSYSNNFAPFIISLAILSGIYLKRLRKMSLISDSRLMLALVVALALQITVSGLFLERNISQMKLNATGAKELEQLISKIGGRIFCPFLLRPEHLKHVDAEPLSVTLLDYSAVYIPETLLHRIKERYYSALVFKKIKKGDAFLSYYGKRGYKHLKDLEYTIGQEYYGPLTNYQYWEIYLPKYHK